jgi:hypothetical protein
VNFTINTRPASATHVAHASGSQTPGVTRDLAVCALLLLLAAFLGVFVHPLLWSVAVLALAWLVGRDPQTRRPRAK